MASAQAAASAKPLYPRASSAFKPSARSPRDADRPHRSRWINGLLGKSKRLLHFAQAAGHGNLFAVTQDHEVLAAEHGLEFLNEIYVHERGAADSHEFFRVELFLERVQGLAQNLRLLAGMDGHVVAGRLNHFNFGGFKYDHF